MSNFYSYISMLESNEVINITPPQTSRPAKVTAKVFSIFYSYISILESNKVINISPPQISRHAKLRHEINLFSQFLDSIRETLK